METPTLKQINALQETYGLTDLQKMIDSGQAWKMEGHYGRTAMSALEQGACILPETAHQDYYGNTVPSRNSLLNGTKGTLANAQMFWQKVLNGEIELEIPED